MDAIAWFMGYRILIVLGGILSIYFGYRLFYLEKSRQGELQIKTGEHYALTMRDVAPGIFFSLFGSLILATCLLRGITIRPGAVVELTPSEKQASTTKPSSADISQGVTISSDPPSDAELGPVISNVSPDQKERILEEYRARQEKKEIAKLLKSSPCYSQRAGEC
nr:hypothetical protein [uncultured Noviherbaspirillum sp.]